MDHHQGFDLATQQLDRVLGFFPRVDTKISFLFALDTGLLALMLLNLKLVDFGIWYVVSLAAVTTGLISASLIFLYLSSSPDLKGGEDSLIYFREISKRTEAKFVSECLAQPMEVFTKDALGQVWRNSCILSLKFKYVGKAFLFTALSLVPWVGFLTATSLLHSQLLVR